MKTYFLQLGNGEIKTKAECEELKQEFALDVLSHWDEFEQTLTSKQLKHLKGN